MGRKRTTDKGAFELLEETVHLLRFAPMSAWLCYYLGSIPFVLGLLFFWADMSRSAFAAQHVGRAAFGLVLLFAWMKAWQSIFAEQLVSEFTGRNRTAITPGRVIRLAITQVIYQPSGFFLIPIAFLIMLPFGWVFAFYLNAVILAGTGTKPLFKTTMQQAGYLPGQNHVGLLVLTAFGFFIWLNLLTLIFTVPGLIKTFLGIETAFTRLGIFALFNTTFWLVSFALAYLCVDPFIKSFYALRCFYGQSVTTGDDLKAEIRSRASVTPILVFVLVLLSVFSPPILAQSGSLNSASLQSAVSSSELDQSIERVLNQPEFSWRSPREKLDAAASQKNWIALFVESVFQTLMDWMRSIRDTIRDFLQWLDKFFKPKDTHNDNAPSGTGWMTTLQISLFVLIALIASALALLLFRMWKRRAPSEIVMAEAVAVTPDLNDENIAANQLPEDGWLKLARELMEKGDLRLALRAYYLAGLAHLGERQFLDIAKFKSNREYERELRRRARSLPDLQHAFAENVTMFDRVWYGMHDVSLDLLQGFQSNLERIRSC